MNISDRIQQLRKSKGISQEELADKLGVSRQAVSKWESEQSSPDIEKIILMSEYFDVTTDYILKGIEPLPSVDVSEKPNAVIFSVTGTAFNLMGIVTAAMIWHEEQVGAASAVGFLFLIIGCMIYGIGTAVSDKTTIEKARRNFWLVNIWVLPFIPLSVIFNILGSAPGPGPYPILGGSIGTFLLNWVLYLVIGVTGSLIVNQKK